MKWLAVGLGVAMLWGSLANADAQTAKTITMRDACDPDTFNAVVGDGTCIPGQHGNTLFTDFVGELTTDQIAGAWRFNPLLNTTEGNFRLARLDLRSGDQTTIQNAGGETHTFTRVQNFGGESKVRLNALTGNPDPARRAFQMIDEDFKVVRLNVGVFG